VKVRRARLPLGRPIADPEQHPLDADVLVERIPVQPGAAAAHLVGEALLGRGAEQSREVRERHAEDPAVGEIDPHRVLVEAHAPRAHTPLATVSSVVIS
jgi:hypothetical protein